MGKGGGDAPPVRVNQSPALHQKNGYPSQKSLIYSTLNPFSLSFFTVHVSSSIKLKSCSSLQMTEKKIVFI